MPAFSRARFAARLFPYRLTSNPVAKLLRRIFCARAFPRPARGAESESSAQAAGFDVGRVTARDGAGPSVGQTATEEFRRHVCAYADSQDVSLGSLGVEVRLTPADDAEPAQATRLSGFAEPARTERASAPALDVND